MHILISLDTIFKQNEEPIYFKLIAFIFICFLLSSCKTLNVTDKTSLSSRKSEGFMFVAITSNIPLSISLFPRNEKSYSGFSSHAVAVFDIRIGENLVMIKLPAGYYTFKYIYPENTISAFELSDMIFEVAQNTINYIGNLNIYQNRSIYEINYVFSDNYDADFAFLNIIYPNLVKTYLVKNNTPLTNNIQTAKRHYHIFP